MSPFPAIRDVKRRVWKAADQEAIARITELERLDAEQRQLAERVHYERGGQSTDGLESQA